MPHFLARNSTATQRSTLLAEVLAAGLLTSVVAAADCFGLPFLVFPEMGALASDVLARPRGKWAAEPLKLIATPALTAVIGTLIVQHLPYGVGPILLAVIASLMVIRFLRSNVAPAISAGVLPIALDVRSWLYPLGILGTLSILALLLELWKRSPPGHVLATAESEGRRTTEQLESPPRSNHWLLSHLIFVAVMGGVAQLSGLRFILFPPLVVIAYEMLGHPETCPWAKPPYTFSLVSAASALAGVEFLIWIPNRPIAAAATLAVSTLLLRGFRLRMPPVHAIGLIPFVMAAPKPIYAASVLAGSATLTIWFLVYRRIELRRGEAGSSPPIAAS